MYLLDTNVLICALFAPERLSATARKAVEGSETLFVSVVSLWEIAIKQSIGKLDIDASIPEIADACARFILIFCLSVRNTLKGSSCFPAFTVIHLTA